MATDPVVSIGLPVFNGERFLAAAIDSLLSQTFRSIDLIISDNASTDQTEQICQGYAAADDRVRYSRLPRNVGGVPNANRVFSLARGAYFMWAAHDDIWRPSYIQRCVDALEQDSGAVLACSEMALIDDAGELERPMVTSHTAGSAAAVERLCEFLQIYSVSDAAYGVIRADVLRKTGLFRLHPGHDKILLAELALYGRFIRLSDYLYLRRQHAQRSVRVYPGLKQRYAWVSPDLAGRRVFPHWAYLGGYASAVMRAPLGFGDRFSCGIALLKWARHHWRELAGDLKA